jgi:hypothetical protein
MKSLTYSNIIYVFIMFLALYPVLNKSISIKSKSNSLMENKNFLHELRNKDGELIIKDEWFRIISNNLNHFNSYVTVEEKGLLVVSSNYNLGDESLWQYEKTNKGLLFKNKKFGLYLDANQIENNSKSFIGLSKKNIKVSNSQIWLMDNYHIRNFSSNNCLKCDQGDERYYACIFKVQTCDFNTKTQIFSFEVTYDI